MNGDWFAWAGQNDPASFVVYWRNAVDAMRAVAGNSFRFDWNPIAGGSFPVDALYPGDAWVDIIGLDVYDQGWWPGWEDPNNRWHEIMYQPYGLAWHRDFAAAHDKPMSFPEFGLSDSPAHHGGGDSPYFVEKMYEWDRPEQGRRRVLRVLRVRRPHRQLCIDEQLVSASEPTLRRAL